jgi:hypothetical protein
MGRGIEDEVHSDAHIRRREVDAARRTIAAVRRLVGTDVAQRNEPRAIRAALESLPAEPMHRPEADIVVPDPRPPMPDPAPPIPPGPEVPDPLPPPPDPAPVKLSCGLQRVDVELAGEDVYPLDPR